MLASFQNKGENTNHLKILSNFNSTLKQTVMHSEQETESTRFEPMFNGRAINTDQKWPSLERDKQRNGDRDGYSTAGLVTCHKCK